MSSSSTPGHRDSTRDELSGWPLGKLLALAGRLVAARFQQALAGQRITPAGFTVLARLAADGALSGRALAAACHVRPATLTGLLDTLAREGYVRRVPAPSDRRAMRVEITPAGHERLASTLAVMPAAMGPVFAGLEPTDEATVRRFLVSTIERVDPSSTSTPDQHQGGTR